MGRYRKLVTDTVLMAIGNFSSKVLVFLLLPFYTYILSTEEYGVADLFTTTISMLIPILTLSISEATFRFAFDKDVDQEKNIFCSLLIVLISCIILLPITGVLSFWNSSFLQYSVFFVALYLSNAVHTCLVNYARGTDYVRVFVLSNVLHTILLVFLNILFLSVLEVGLKGYLLSMIVAYCGSALYIFISLRCWRCIRIRNIDLSLCRKMLHFSVPMIFSTAAWWVMNSISKYMIIDAYGMDASGVYGVAQKIPTILTVLTSIFVQAWQISAINAYGEKDSDEFYTNVYKVYEVGLYLVATALIFMTKPLAAILFQKDYYGAFVYVPVLILSGVFTCLASFLQSPFVAGKKSGVLLQSTIVGAVVNIILNIIFVPVMGPIGAAYATMLGFATTWIIRMITSRKLVTIQVKWIKTLLTMVLLVLQAVLVSQDVAYSMIYSGVIVLIIIVIYFETIRTFIKNIFRRK